MGGSFNPPHIGHLAIANYLCETGAVDELWLLVTPQNPLKQECELLDEQLRLKMAQLAVENYPKIKVSDFEFSLPRPSYTLHTLEALSHNYPSRDFVWVMGADNWERFHRWYQWETILQHYALVIYPRPGFEVDEAALPPHVSFVQAPLMDISSTFIRHSIGRGMDVRFFMPAPVAAFVQQFKLYQN